MPYSPKKEVLPARQGQEGSPFILETTDTETVRTVVVVRVGVAAVEVQVAGVAAIHRTAPVVAVAACVVDRAVVVVAVPSRDKAEKQALAPSESIYARASALK